MKRKIALLLTAGLILTTLAGCGGTQTNVTTSGGNGSAQTETSQVEGEASGTESTESESADSADSAVEAESAPAGDTHLNVALFLFMQGLDPANGWDGWKTMRCGIGETLVTINENNKLVPWLAESWEQEDELTYRFKIREGVKFSNGNDMTPEIVRDALLRTRDINSRGEALKLADVTVDGEDVICTTTEPFSAFIYNLTEPMCIIVDTSVDTSEYETNPIGTGPYRVTEFVAEERVELEANEHYWGGVPEIKTISVLNIGGDTQADAILSGELDVAQGPAKTTLSRMENQDNIDFAMVTGTREEDVVLNCRADNPLSDQELRLALSYAVDRDIIAQVAGNGYATGLGTAFPPSAGYDSDKVEGQRFDMEKAKEHLAAAGYEDVDGDGFVEKNGEKLTLKISLSSTSATPIYEALQTMWKDLGVDIEIEMLENLSDKRASGDFDIISYGYQSTNSGDGQAYLHLRWQDGGEDNFGAYKSEAFEAAMEELDKAFTTEERVACYVKLQQILADESPNIFLYANDNVTLINKEKVSNVTVFPLDYYFITGDWKAK